MGEGIRFGGRGVEGCPAVISFIPRYKLYFVMSWTSAEDRQRSVDLKQVGGNEINVHVHIQSVLSGRFMYTECLGGSERCNTSFILDLKLIRSNQARSGLEESNAANQTGARPMSNWIAKCLKVSMSLFLS